jgi:fibronectin type 3 domain-containing protein
VLVNNLSATAVSYSDTHSLSAGTTYYYEVVALTKNAQSAPSNVAGAATWTAPPNQPANLSGAGTLNTANPALGAVGLAWQDNATNETGYSVERSNGGTWSVVATLPANSTSYTDTGLTLGATYSYRVRCFSGATASAYSTTVKVTATPTAPAQPGSLSATAVSSSQVNLTWQDKAINESSYSVERSSNGHTWSVIASLPANSTSYADTGVAGGTAYSYRVRALDGTLASKYTNSASATTPANSPVPGPAAGAVPGLLSGNSSAPPGGAPTGSGKHQGPQGGSPGTESAEQVWVILAERLSRESHLAAWTPAGPGAEAALDSLFSSHGFSW